MSQKSKWDYLKAIYFRYQKASKPLRARILDEFCQVCGYNRKYAIRLLNGPEVGRRPLGVCSWILRPSGRRLAIRARRGSKLSYRYGSLGLPTLRYLGPSPKAVALDQPRHHRPATQAQKTPTQKQTLRTHQTRHSAQTSAMLLSTGFRDVEMISQFPSPLVFRAQIPNEIKWPAARF